MDIDFAAHHSMDVSTEVCSNEGRMSSFSCATCVKFVHHTCQTHLQSRDIRLSNFIVAASTQKSSYRVCLYIKCIGKYHRHMYGKVLGSSNL